MSYTDEELKAMFTKTAPAVVDAVGSVDPSMARPQSAQTVMPPPSSKVEPTGLGVVGKGMEALGERAAADSRGAVQGLGDASLNMHILMRDILDTVGITDSDKTGKLKAQVLKDRKAFYDKEKEGGHGSIASEASRIGGELAAGYVLGGGPLKAGLQGVTQAGKLLPGIAGQANTAMIQGAAEDTQGDLLSKLGSGGRNAGLTIAFAGTAAGFQSLRKTLPPGTEGLSASAAKGVDKRAGDIKAGAKMAKEAWEDIASDRTLVDKLRTGLLTRAKEIETQNSKVYDAVFKKADEYGKIPLAGLLKDKRIIALTPSVDNPVVAPGMKEMLGKVDEFIKTSGGSAKASDIQKFTNTVLEPIVATAGNKQTLAAKEAFKTFLTKELDNISGSNGAALGSELKAAGQNFKNIIMPVRDDLGKISNALEKGQIDDAVNIFGKSANKVALFKAIHKTLGPKSQEAFGDLLAVQQYNKSIIGHTLKNGDIVDPKVLFKSFNELRKSPSYKVLGNATRAKVDTFVDFMSRQVLSPASKNTQGDIIAGKTLKGTLASIPAFFTDLMNTSGGGTLLYKASTLPKGSLARQRIYLELGKTLSLFVEGQVAPVANTTERKEYSDSELKEMFKGKK